MTMDGRDSVIVKVHSAPRTGLLPTNQVPGLLVRQPLWVIPLIGGSCSGLEFPHPYALGPRQGSWDLEKEGTLGECVWGSPGGHSVRFLHLKGHWRTFSKPFLIIPIE